MSRTLARVAAVADRRVTGLSLEVLAELIAELGPRWQACRDARLADRPRRRAVGAGARYRLVFIDRLWATLVHLRHGVTASPVTYWLAGSRCPARRLPGRSERSVRCWPTADAASKAGLAAHPGRCGRPPGRQGTARPAGCHRGPGTPPGRGSGRPAPVRLRQGARQHVNALVITDTDVRLLFCGQTRPGSIHDLLASPVPSPRPTRAPRHHPARGRRTDLQPGTSPTTRTAPPPIESPAGRHHGVIESALARSTTARG